MDMFTCSPHPVVSSAGLEQKYKMTSNLILSSLVLINFLAIHFRDFQVLKYRKGFVEDILDIQPTDRERCNMLIVLLVVRFYTLFEPRHEKTGFLHMQKQRRRSASR